MLKLPDKVLMAKVLSADHVVRSDADVLEEEMRQV